jgi:ketosteroid isomerase-like protein
MRSWLAKKIIDRQLARLRAGDYRPLLRLYAEDVRFVFPGDSTWSGEVRGREAMGRWLQRLVGAGLQNFAEQVIVGGPPWNMTMAMRGWDYVKDPDGQVVYENRYVLWGRMRWGHITEYEAYEDTNKLNALDDYLASHDMASADRARGAG